MMALTTKVNRPRVKILMGNVRNINIGRKKIFKTPIRTDAISAEENPEILKPGTKYEVINKATEVKNQTNNQ